MPKSTDGDAPTSAPSYGAEQARAGREAGMAARYDDEQVDRSTEKNKPGTWALILGIASIVLLVFPPIIALTLGTMVCIASIVLGIKGVRAASAGLSTTRAQAFCGLLLGGVALVLYVAAIWGAVLVQTGAIDLTKLG
ncbi:hypothetical protein V2J56_07955 [Georgenia sp. MJ206]|uniref:hypothetical protein n=1 Tax=Georgenia wangjunii TaxID=3117730 RepID=UPI002F26CE02